MKTFFIKTHGCKANQLESSVIKEKLLNAGYSESTKANDAGIYILNSCSVTETADTEALRTLRNIKHKNPKILTVLTGCSAQLNPQDIDKFDFVDIILGNDDKFGIVDAINNKKNSVTDIFKIKNHFNLFKNVNNDILEYVNTEIKYEGYIRQEKELIDKMKSIENITLPEIEYKNLSGLRLEARQKLDKFKPSTLGQAKRIDGVSPSDINVLLVYLKLKGII